MYDEIGQDDFELLRSLGVRVGAGHDKYKTLALKGMTVVVPEEVFMSHLLRSMIRLLCTT